MMGITGQTDVRLIAFYLPQFHPIPENDEWWGKGFTEWVNLSRAKPFFEGHEHPRIPGELGYYDLRLPEVREQQAELARAHGIHGFCYYDYWFAGRRLLERPLTDMLASGRPDFPFCVCWANENWTRRWDGHDSEVLIAQKHTPETDAAYIRHLLPIIRDPRYIRVGGAPLILVYRPGILPDAAATVAEWRRVAAEGGEPNLFICAVQSFGFTDPRPFGFDAAVEFPPHNLVPPDASAQVRRLDPSFAGKIYDYRQVAHVLMNRKFDEFLTFRTVFPGWDNTPRRGKNGFVFLNSSPAGYEGWLHAMAMQARARPAPEHRLLFVNAWNEWAEGAYLEPDRAHGRDYLEATHRAMTNRSSWQTILASLRADESAKTPVAAAALDALETHLRSQARALSYFEDSMSMDIQSFLHRPIDDFAARAHRAELARVQQEAESMRQELERERDAQVGVLNAQLQSIFESRSWRVTKPLRAVLRLLSRGG